MSEKQAVDASEAARVQRAVESAWDQGCPVAHDAGRIAPRAIRRWKSSIRRHVDPSDHEERIEDLADGLIASFEAHPKLVGPLRSDYLFLSEIIAQELTD